MWVYLIFLLSALVAHAEESCDIASIVPFELLQGPHEKKLQSQIHTDPLRDTPYTLSPRVDLVSGQYVVDATDMVVAGIEPLLCNRHYFGGTWGLPWQTELWGHYNQETCEALFTRERGKSPLTLVKSGEAELSVKQNGKCLSIHPDRLSRHPLNVRATYKCGRISTREKITQPKYAQEIKGKLTDGDGTTRSFFCKKSKEGDCYCPFLVTEERRPNGNILVFDYYPEKYEWTAPRVKSITAYNRTKTKVLGFLNYSYTEKKYTEEVVATGSDGREVRFLVGGGGLRKVQAPSLPCIEYREGSQIYEEKLPKGVSLTTQYADYGVCTQSAPIGPNGELEPIFSLYRREGHSLFYLTNPKGARKELIDYHYDDQGRLIHIAVFDKFDFTKSCESLAERCAAQQQRPYRLDRYFWNDTTGNLEKQTIEDGLGKVRLVKEYRYDAHHNVIEEKIGDGHESYSHYYTYSDDDFNLKLSEWDDYGMKILYRYLPETNLLTERFVYDGNAICQRTFHEYDDAAVCIRTVVDDGCSENPNDLTGVRYRKILEVTPKESLPCYGLPEVVVEKSIDAQGKEVLLGKIVYTYAPSGAVLTEAHYDANGTYCYTLQNRYNDHECLVEERDALGHATFFSYDLNHNIARITSPLLRQEFTHDQANRCTRIVERHTDGILATTRSYDTASRLTSQTDCYGRETRYAYDFLGRCVKVIHPDGAVEQREYDLFNNVTREIDARGYSTRREYNFRGQPTAVYYPDGSEEHFTYAPNGEKRSHTTQNGATTYFSYDLFGHVTETRVVSSEGELLKRATATYTPFLQLSATDAMGVTTFYDYNAAGQLLAEECAGRTISYTYDALGRRMKSTADQSVTCVEYDYLNQVIEKRQEDLAGTVLAWERYRYDAAGNRTHVIDAMGTAETMYDTHRQPSYQRDALGRITYFDNLIPREKYPVCRERIRQETLPNGNVILHVLDVRDREQERIVKNPRGEVVQRRLSTFDAAGNLVKQQHEVFAEGKPTKSVVHTMEYGPCNKITALLEAGLRKTEYLYDTCGRLQTIVKPDGERIHHRYNDLGLLTRYTTRGAAYLYTYDAADRVVSVVDKESGSVTQRCYNLFGDLIEEKLANGLVLKNEYDSYGHRLASRLPDGSTIEYAHGVLGLQAVTRGNLTYAYEERDLRGHVTKARLPKGLGQLTTLRDVLGRPQEIFSAYFSAHYGEYDAANNLLSYSYSDGCGSKTLEYQYDALSQLVKEEGHSYRYDSLYNRLERDGVTYQVDALCQVKGVGEEEYRHDVNGDLVEQPGRRLEYDGQHRLVRVEEEGWAVVYTYDAFQRRIAKSRWEDGREVSRVLYLWDGKREIGAVIGGRLEELRVLGEGIQAEVGATLFMELYGKSYVPLHDHRGAVVVLVDAESGQPVEHYRYTAFGEEMTGNSLSPWRFSSKRVDEETGWLFFGRRYYAASLGRWITPDPKGFSDGPNLYAYISNNPLLGIDAYGEHRRDLAMDREERRHCGRENRMHYSKREWPEKPIVFKREGTDPSNQAADILVNGVNTRAREMRARVDKTHDMCNGEIDVLGYYVPTHGLISDLFRAMLELFGVTSPEVRGLVAVLTEYAEANPHKRLLVNPHSEGGIITRNVLPKLSEEIRNRITVVAIAPGAFIRDGLCAKATHYICSSDIVPRLDRKENRIACRNSIVVLRPPEGESFWHMHHSYDDPIYAEFIESETKDFVWQDEK